jgi:hypothetical protein
VADFAATEFVNGVTGHHNIRPHIGLVPDNPCRDRLSPIVDSWAILPTNGRLYTMIAPHDQRHANALASRGRVADQQIARSKFGVVGG